jgi:hypothetical protein
MNCLIEESMGLENYVSEAEAIQRSGVSLKTLQRFVEAGYLSVEVEPDGLRLYSRSQLDEIFGIHTAPLSLEPLEEDRDGNSILSAQGNVEPSMSNTSVGVSSEPRLQSHSENATNVRGSYYENPETVPFLTASTEEPAGLQSKPQVEGDHEVLRLRNIVKLQEALLDTKDAELKDLRDERQWLRTRIEKLEEKGERDQILLLSETQTIRKLIVVQEQKKSTIKQLLSWVGLLPEPREVENSTQDLMRATSVKDFKPRSEGAKIPAAEEKKVANS